MYKFSLHQLFLVASLSKNGIVVVPPIGQVSFVFIKIVGPFENINVHYCHKYICCGIFHLLYIGSQIISCPIFSACNKILPVVLILLCRKQYLDQLIKNHIAKPSVFSPIFGSDWLPTIWYLLWHQFYYMWELYKIYKFDTWFKLLSWITSSIQWIMSSISAVSVTLWNGTNSQNCSVRREQVIWSRFCHDFN